MENDHSQGKSKGGKARAESLTSDERKSIAQKAARSRWTQEREVAALTKATHGSADSPLKIGDIEIPCFVLEDGKRVLVQTAMLTALDMSQGTAGKGAGDRIAKFLATKSIKPHADKYLGDVIISPIKFRTPTGSVAHGYEATILADICDAVLEARKEGSLHYQQEHIAKQCEILVRGFARVGIIALVDEATGYQKDRAKDALSKILEAFVVKELQPWVKTFPSEFYENMFRLREIPYPSNSVKRPQYFGYLTNDIIYRRLAPGVLNELKEQAEKNEKGRLKHRLFQKLTTDIGHPKLKELVVSVITVMKLSDHWNDFKHKLDRVHPAYNDSLQLPFELEGDSGKGI